MGRKDRLVNHWRLPSVFVFFVKNEAQNSGYNDANGHDREDMGVHRIDFLRLLHSLNSVDWYFVYSK